MLKTLIILSIFFSWLTVSGQSLNYSLKTGTDIDWSALKDGFLNPPEESRLHCYWWWLNSMVTRESITNDLEEMKAKGYSGAILFDAGTPPGRKKIQAGPTFMSPQWMELYQHAVREAERLNIELSVNVQSGWNPGAPFITPEMALKKLVYAETEVKGGKQVRMDLPQPETNLIYHDITVQAIPIRSAGSPVKNDAIVNWDKKSFNKALGWQGVYPLHELREGFDNSVTVDIIQKDEIIDLSDRFDGKQLTWDVPEGNWLVIRYGWTCTGARTERNSDGWSGLSMDHLNPEVFSLYSKNVIIPLIEAAQSAGNSVKFLFTDSWEMGIANWTKKFPTEFKKFRGYTINPYLPVMTGRVVESQDVSNRFLQDLRKTVGDCVFEYHYRLFSNLAHQYGLGIHPESGGPHSAPIDALRVMGISDYPQGEFWARSNTHRVTEGARIYVKQCASVAHTNGIRIAAAEGPTSIGPQWERAPKDLKGTIDRVFCSGINRITWQTFTASPKEFGIPGNEYFNGTHLNPNEIWWNKAGDFISYINRCCFLLQQGLFVADVLYYYGDDVPNFVFLKEEYPELNFGYDWDKCSKDVILNRLSVKDGRPVLPDGMSYRVLVPAPVETIDLDVLRKVEQLVNEGMTVLAPRPKKVSGLSGYPEADRELTSITDRLWGKIDGEKIFENKVGQGRVIWGRDINQVLAEMNVKPDLSFRSNQGGTALDYIHKSTDNQEIYFIANRHLRKGINDFDYRYLTDLPDRYEHVECTFRVSGKIPQLWDPLTGEMKEILVYREENGQTIIPLHLNPEGSVFVVFNEAPSEDHVHTILKDGKKVFPGNSFQTSDFPLLDLYKKGRKKLVSVFEPGNYTLSWSNGRQQTIKAEKPSQGTELSGKWDLYFDPQWGGPEKIEINELKSWIKFEDPKIKYYSGAARYSKTFTLTKNEIKDRLLILNLGNVQEMASLRINGYQTPLLWSYPFRSDITPFVKEGKNELEIEVINLWPNRLIGDGKLPENQRLTRTNITDFDAPDAEKRLRESGLLEPVVIRSCYQYELK
ncbi:MAG: glycosyl hydrolase [Mangrovibacterium sp.]